MIRAWLGGAALVLLGGVAWGADVGQLGGNPQLHSTLMDVQQNAAWRIVPDCTGNNSLTFTQATDSWGCIPNGGSSGITGMTAGQIPIAATATTVTSSIPTGTGVQTALGVNVSSAGAFVVNGGALGTPSSGVLTNATGLPIGGITGLGTGVGTALAVNVGSAGAPVVLGGALGTPTSGVGTNITGVVNNNVLATTTVAGGSGSLTGPRQNYICTGTCTITVPVPVAGYEFCVMNDDNVATVITLAALGSSAMYETTARTAYGTAGTGTMVSNGAAANRVCLLGRDATHYLTVSSVGTWTVN